MKTGNPNWIARFFWPFLMAGSVWPIMKNNHSKNLMLNHGA
ncbi:hypothetical protein ADICYQ_4547 [Cyclobacterium qasimii M12-11B]|uniref:Uncharacterized protein n=1 Tax=Cyclobacterium qasimii M12-11B TaxID=641524 RepID=S7WQL2_9BACT|nr:hypothetical protein ADICYQ_4547 [Cyclobacterium qasimii M12-11B]